MSEIEPLIADLALILICAGVMTLLFKRLKQPVVLGYIVAGFIASPNMPYMPSVTDLEGVHLWSEIGVIFLLFAFGLEFSFRKILRMGAAPIIAACAIIMGMMLVGMFTGQLFGWSQMDCIYLGGMLAMSSTTIIFCSPFLWALMRLGSHSDDVITVWNSGRASRVKLMALQLLCLVIGAAFVSYVFGHTVHWGGMLGIFVVLAVVFSIVFSPRLRKRGERLSKTFTENLTQREQQP